MTDGQTAPIRVGLLVDELLSSVITLVLAHIGGVTKRVDTDLQLRGMIKDWSPQLVVVDIDRYEDAPDWLSKLSPKPMPSVALTRRRDVIVKLDAFARGAYDVIEVPFTPDEIVGRVAASYARAYRLKPTIQLRCQVGPLEMDLGANGVHFDHTMVRLSPIELTLLYLFLANRGRVLSRDQILGTLWGSTNMVTSNVVDRHVRDLRVKLGDDWRQPVAIETVPGQGYRFVADGHVRTATGSHL